MKNLIINKITLILLILILVCSCSNLKVIKNNKKVYITNNTIYRINAVQVYLDSKCHREEFPNGEELSKILTEKIRDKICNNINCLNENEDNIANNNDIVDINFSINYQRVFFGQLISCKGGYIDSLFYFNNTITKDNILIGSYKTNQSNKMHISYGAKNSLGHNLKAISNKSGPEEEQKALDIIANDFSEKILELLK